ncbi:methyltransferase [Bryobacterales bacterium F-183]|nr:methyltransferase [Bryobacterales bacterium F-183]
MPIQPYYQGNGITLYLGDNREILPELPSETFDLTVTDPPYLVSYAGRWGSGGEPIEGDSDPSWVLPTYSEVFRVLREDALCLTFYGWPHADVFLGAWRKAGFRPISVYAFVKRRIGLGQFTRAQHELAYLLAKGKPRRPDNAPSDVLEWAPVAKQLHPNQKPVQAISRLVAAYSSATSHILDPFSGSGTTLLAARYCALPAVGIEIEERFCEIAARQLSLPMLDLDFRASLLTYEGEPS